MNKLLPWLMFGFALLGAAYVCALLLDAGIALDSARSEVARQSERSALSLSIIRKEWVGKDARSVAILSRELEQQGVIVGTDGSSLEIGDLVFEIKQGSVADVRYIDSAR